MKSPSNVSKLKKSTKIQVSRTKLPHPTGGKDFICKYSDVPTDDFGWVTDLRYYPISFDMMTVRLQDKRLPIAAWWDGRKWTGLRFRKGNKVTAWKRQTDYD